jgi:hypothetical protein
MRNALLNMPSGYFLIEMHREEPTESAATRASFKFTRGRFIVDEVENLRKREIRFDMNRLARVAAALAMTSRPSSIDMRNALLNMPSGYFLIEMHREEPE